MHFEFKKLIADTLPFVRESFPALPLEVRFHTDDCPQGIQGAVTANAAFVASSLLQNYFGRRDAQWSPEEIARCIEQGLPQLRASRCFRLSVSPSGHLNAIPADAFVDLFVLRARLSKGAVLLNQEPFVVGEGGLMPQQGVSFDGSWLERALRLSEAKELVRIQGEAASGSGRLMLLGLLADRELNTKPYLLNIGSRENIPAYLSKFLADALSLIQAAGDAPPFGLSWRDPGSKRASSSAVLLHLLVRKILSFRFVLARAAAKSEPELLLRFVLDLVHGFNSFYNYPQSRTVTAWGPATRANIGSVLEVSRAMVERTLLLLAPPSA